MLNPLVPLVTKGNDVKRLSKWKDLGIIDCFLVFLTFNGPYITIYHGSIGACLHSASSRISVYIY